MMPLLQKAAQELEYLRLLLATKSADTYRANLRANARALWLAEWDEFDFYVAMLSTVRRAFTQAFYEGAAVCGIAPQELSRGELLRLEEEIVQENSYIDGLADFISENSKAMGGKLTDVYTRVELWVQGYARVKNLGQITACGDLKLKWNLHPAEHCTSCLKLAGKVKRASFWEKLEVFPKAWDKLICRLGCKCTLDPTDEPLTPGPLPSLP